jgi:hypothetical protein
MRMARTVYQQALAETDRGARTRGFADAARTFRALGQAHPDCPELLTDWGNAALGSQDLGHAALAYRRALRLDAGLARARRNLAWVRERAATGLPRPGEEGAIDALFFWHDRLPTAPKLGLGALAFAVTVLLLTPWARTPSRRRPWRRLAAVPALVWLALTASALLERDTTRDAVVVVDGPVLRAADSPGAPATLAQPLPAGTEITLLETRDSWSRVALPGGARGWLPAHTLARVVPP